MMAKTFLETPPGLFCLAGVIRRIEVFDLPRTDAVQLNHRLALGPDKMLHACGPVAKRAGWHFRCCALLKFVAHP